jgi:hypothetical protein
VRHVCHHEPRHAVFRARHQAFPACRLYRKEQELAALCRRRASLWGDAIREGLDPDIARFFRDQAAAWQLLTTSYARSAREALAGLADAA